jgi:hypothetical protein
MARMMEHVATLNSVVRTILAVVLVGALGYGGWIAYATYNEADLHLAKQTKELEEARKELVLREQAIKEKDAAIADLNRAVQERDKKIEHLNTAMRLLKMDHRLARLTVLDQKTAPDPRETVTKVSFVEVNDEGYPIDAERVFELKGDMVYIDHWVVKFEDKYVEQADLDRSTSICLFRRIFGEFQEPSQGYVIDEVGTRPTAYGRGSKMSEFERNIWNDFWTIANDPEKAKSLGIRAAHGEAVSIKVEPAKRYQVQLRASDGLSITPLPDEKKPPRS